MWIKRGYRYTHTGRMLSTGKVRLRVITPDQLAGRLIGLTGDPERRSTNAAPWHDRTIP